MWTESVEISLSSEFLPSPTSAILQLSGKQKMKIIISQSGIMSIKMFATGVEISDWPELKTHL